MEINVEEVVNGIKSEIERDNVQTDIPTFTEVMSVVAPEVLDYDGDQMHELVCSYNAKCYLIESTPIKGNRIIVFIKRLIRKFTRFYIRPLVDAQNSVNSIAGRIFTALDRDLNAEGTSILTELADRNAILELKFKKLDAEMTRLVDKVNELEAENKELREKLK